MRTDHENNNTFKKNGLTLKIKVNYQGLVTDFGFSEILDIVNVRIDTKIESIACIQPEISKVIWKRCMALSSKVKHLRFWDTWVFSTFSISQASKMSELIQRSCLYDVYNQRYVRSHTFVFDRASFSRSIFFLSRYSLFLSRYSLFCADGTLNPFHSLTHSRSIIKVR